MTEDEPRDWYAEGDAYEQRLTLARRITVMVVLTVLAVPVVRVLDGGDGGNDAVAAGVETTSVSDEPTAIGATAPTATTAPAAVVTVGPITTGPGTEAAPSNHWAAVDVDIAGLPEITAPADSATPSQRSGEDSSFEGLPEITAPPSATAAPAASAAIDDEPAATTDAGSATTADDDEPAATTASTKPPSTTTTEDEPATTTTTAPPPPPSYSPEEVQQLIRDAWPDGADEEMALTVAQRESGFRADAVSPTKCCLGIFQIHYEANVKLINSLGFDRNDLFDAAKNVQIAYAMWQRSGWGPWSQTAHQS